MELTTRWQTVASFAILVVGGYVAGLVLAGATAGFGLAIINAILGIFAFGIPWLLTVAIRSEQGGS